MPLHGYLLSRFIEYGESISLECKRNDTFRSLCEDLNVCADALARWRRSDAEVSPARVAEYSEWLRELEREIEEWIGL